MTKLTFEIINKIIYRSRNYDNEPSIQFLQGECLPLEGVISNFITKLLNSELKKKNTSASKFDNKLLSTNEFYTLLWEIICNLCVDNNVYIHKYVIKNRVLKSFDYDYLEFVIVKAIQKYLSMIKELRRTICYTVEESDKIIELVHIPKGKTFKVYIWDWIKPRHFDIDTYNSVKSWAEGVSTLPY
jgi:hypothetical protein